MGIAAFGQAGSHTHLMATFGIVLITTLFPIDFWEVWWIVEYMYDNRKAVDQVDEISVCYFLLKDKSWWSSESYTFPPF